ncbi:MAG: ABC transporter ATP-binding protein [Opitutae bacterium]|jgi:ABC-2 type transport system ATP-binding protein|nr:ABC transporter ATP-binding protein [Opitutae bacterium]MBT4666143.1 ABC transporter ATP-binding protein [Opitutae bacterium]MBT5908489.1 ABC transporter ATP-binding protein [Opitutae bacterium]MBT6849863.1 ABC transporter ATP-binding protein [Opitutae bacterium]MBT7740200.1 ABC transporter ATP-binding protein [Opitutae bacterium]
MSESTQHPKPMIEAKGLCKYYGDFIAVEDLNFAINEGEVVAFLGPNGAGKSTTMKMLTGFLAPSAGTSRICGLEVSENRAEVANRIGYLPENGPLYEEMTPVDLLNFFGDARGMDKNLKASRIEKVIDQCALQTVVTKPISKLSRGFRQRVGMANVLLHEPDVLIMDEPTAGLDPNQVLEVRKTIKGLGKTILLSTHILQEVRNVADRILLINQGRLVFSGTPDDLKEESSLDDWFNRETKAA